MAEQFDVVIIGGALTGSVLALALSSFSQHKMRVAIVEKSPPDYTQPGGFDARSIALAQGSLQKFRQIRPLAGGNLGELLQQIATPIEQIQVSDQGHFGKVTLKASEFRQPQLGIVVELAKFGQHLTAYLNRQPNICLFCPHQVLEVQRESGRCLLTLSHGERLETALMVAADGIQSQIARQCGVATKICRDYRQSALIANIELAGAHNNQAFERFTAQGPLALLPLDEKRMSLVWCMNQPDFLLNADETDFLSQLQQQFGWQLGKFERVSKRFVYPLTAQKAESHIHHRLAIVGNAAQLLHPVAGQGFNLGLRDLYMLAELLGDAFAQGRDLGEFTLLNRFEQARVQDQAHMMQLTSGLISLFSCQWLPTQALRNLGLWTAAHHQGLRAFIANQALGWQ